RPAARRPVGNAAFFLHQERRAGLEVDRAAERVGRHFRRGRLRDLDFIEERPRNIVRAEIPAEAAGTGLLVSVDAHGVEPGRHATYRNTRDIAFVVEVARDARQSDQQLARGVVRQVAEGGEGDDVLDIARTGRAVERGGV